MDGSPAYVPGEVFAHLKTERTGSPTPMASSPAEVTGDFTVELDPADGVRYGPGFLNGAPLKIGGDFTIRLAPHHRHLSNLLWDKDNGEAVPAFTDGKKRTAASIKVEVKHYCGDYQPSTRRGRPGIMIKGPLPEIIMPGMTVTDDDFVYRVKSMAPYDYVVKNVWSRVANEQKNGQYIN